MVVGCSGAVDCTRFKYWSKDVLAGLDLSLTLFFPKPEGQSSSIAAKVAMEFRLKAIVLALCIVKI